MKKVRVGLMVGAVILSVGLVGCGSNSSSTANVNTSSSSTATSTTTTAQPQNDALKKAFQDEMNGFTAIEQDVSTGNFDDANKLAGQLHDEFHAVILPPLEAKKGTAYAESIHSKYDELQDAVTSKNKDNISKLIQTNRDNLHTVAGILGITL